MDSDNTFRDQVYDWVARIPTGKVMTYGQISALCGHPRAARIVGQIAQFGPEGLPWQRVVYKDGRLAGAFPGGRTFQASLLEGDGVEVSADFTVDIAKVLWIPHQ
jgi:methylated-DNA-protein-cysteine methyltransferase-like protein